MPRMPTALAGGRSSRRSCRGDKARADYLQKAIGYSLTGDTRMECLFILYGPTSRNGKGTTMESILRIMGEYGKNADPTMLQAKFNSQSGRTV